MKVTTTQPFQIIYSLYEHQFLGYLFEASVVQVNTKGHLTYLYQNISYQNAREFECGLDESDFELIRLIDKINQKVIIKKFYNSKNKKVNPEEFFIKVYGKEKGDKSLQKAIDDYIDSIKQKILKLLLQGKKLFIMGKDGLPHWKAVDFTDEDVTVLFHFRKNETDTHYFPTLKHKGHKLEFQYKHARIIANEPAYMLLNDHLYTFAKEVDGKKLKPFLNKKFIVIPKKVEKQYYQKFITSLVASFDVYAKGFEIMKYVQAPQARLKITEYTGEVKKVSLFGVEEKHNKKQTHKILLELVFAYGEYTFRAKNLKDEQKIQVKLEDRGERDYVFYKIYRDFKYEQNLIQQFSKADIAFNDGKLLLNKEKFFGWFGANQAFIKANNIVVNQSTQEDKNYFLGQHTIQIQIREKKDWFDVHAIITFGDYEIPFIKLRKLILQNKTEFKLPNGEIAVIPEEWLTKYADLFLLSTEDKDEIQLKKHHFHLVENLKNTKDAVVEISQKLEVFKDFKKIEDYDMPKDFKGELRPYQKAGYNWLRFLNEANLGACLADDMGLGKTIQTLALIQAQKQLSEDSKATLLIIPTSLIYNWQLEALKFTPKLKVFLYIGGNRNKKIKYFDQYDIIITSYGTARVDINILKHYCFDYLILDESQAIKNPNSATSKAVKQLESEHRLILTGTPLENSTLDLWSQMSFINPGILGDKRFFKQQYQLPIEKKNDKEKLQKLSSVIKPFILRRLKGQVATDLPEKIENVQFCAMTAEQEKAYERVKSQYRNEILKNIESKGLAKSQLLVLKGLNQLRQIANHPRMVDESYLGESGKLEDVLYKLESVVSENHKVLVFSQYVKHLTLIRDELDKKSIKYAYLDGATNHRQAEVDSFQKSKNIKVFLISLKAGGVGLNLTAAEYVFLLDPWWNPAIEAQAVDRAHRIGQTNTVFTYKFISRNTVEEKILALQKQKQDLAESLIHSENGFVKTLNKEDVLALLD